MWSTAQAETAARRVADPERAKSARTPFGRIVTTTLAPAADGRPSLLDLQTGRTDAPPDFLGPKDVANPFSLSENGRFIAWCRDHGVDILGQDTRAEREVEAVVPAKAAAFAAPVAVEPRSPSRLLLGGLDMTVTRIIPQTFDELTVEEAREILNSKTDRKTPIEWMMDANRLRERPDTFAFRTREGALGLLQMQADAKERGKLAIRYRLETRNGSATP
jgi:hypothetical protein